MDDVPIGGGDNKFLSEQPPPGNNQANADADKPLEDRLVSKTWNTRADAYKELEALFKKEEHGSRSQLFKDYSSKMATFLADSNPGALEKAIELFTAFVDRCDPKILSYEQKGYFKPLIEKCLGHAKSNIKAKSNETFLLMFEVSECFDQDTLEALETFCKSKNIKVQMTSVGLLANLIAAFGVKRFPPKMFIKIIEDAANSSNPGIRGEAINCFVALHSWMGAAVDTFTDKLKPQQKDQITKDAEAAKGKPSQKRKTRTEKVHEKEAALDAIIAEEEKEEEKVDVYDMVDGVDIAKKFDQAWIDGYCEKKKWDERRDALLEIINAADVPKILNGNFIDLVAMLKKQVTDSNKVVACHAVKALGNLAQGLRKDFNSHAREIFPVFIANLKEKRMQEELMASLTKFMHSLDLADVVEQLGVGLKHMSPLVKTSTAIFIEKAALITYIDMLNEAPVKQELLPAVACILEDKDSGTRDQGLKTLGVLQGRLGEQALSKYTDGLIPLKKAKVDEAAATVKPSKYDKSQKAKKVPPPAAASTPSAMPKKKPTLTSKKPAPKQEERKNDGVQPKIPARPATAKPTLGASKAAAPKPMKSIAPQEEDIGAGLSKEEAIEKTKEFYSAEHINKFEEAKWQTKQEGYQGIQQQIEELKPDMQTLEATAKFIKSNMKDWKESNINLMKEAIFTLKAMTVHCEKIPKRVVATYSPFLCDKIGDIKVAVVIKEVLMTLAEFVTPKFICQQVCKNAMTAKAPNNLKESCNILTELIEAFGAGPIPAMIVIEYATLAAGNANGQIRTAALKLWATLYKFNGEAIRNFLGDIKESTLKVIDAEFEKVTPLKKGEFVAERQLKDQEDEQPEEQANLMDMIPREDISKLLTGKLLKQFSEKDWKLRKKGCDEIMEILRGAAMRIEPNGLGELMDVMKVAMKESNKAVIKANLEVLGSLAEAVGAPIKLYTKKCFVPSLNYLSEKDKLVRQATLPCIEKWAEAIGAASVLNYLIAACSLENPELRDEVTRYALSQSEAIPNCDHSVMVKPLVACLSDKTAKIRNAAEELVVLVMAHSGVGPFNSAIKDQKTAVQQTLRPIIDRCKGKCASVGVSKADVSMEEEKEEPLRKTAVIPTKRPVTAAPTRQTEVIKPDMASQPQKQPAANSFAAAAKSRMPQRPTTAKVADPSEEEQFVCNPGNKERRAANDERSKWMHEELKPDQVERVKKLCEDCFGFEFMQKMFGADFKKHVQVIQTFVVMIDTQPIELQDIIDIVFKWCYIKLTESTNTTFAVNVFEFFATLFQFLQAQDYKLWDHEAYVVIPLLADKAGINNAIIKGKVKALVKQAFELYDNKKSMQLLIKFGLNGKNLKSVAETLDEISYYVSNNGIGTMTERDMKVIGKLADSPDKGVRENALVMLGEVYKVLDEDIWRVLGQVTVKVKGLLEQRFKKIKGGSSALNTSANRGAITSRIGAPSPLTSRQTVAHSTSSSNLARSFAAQQPQKSNMTPRGTVVSGLKKPASNLNQSLGGRVQSGLKTSGIQSNLQRSLGGQNKFTSSIRSNDRASPAPNRPGTAFQSSSNSKPRQSMVNPSLPQFGGQIQRLNVEQDIELRQNKPTEQMYEDDDADLIKLIENNKPKEVLDPKTQQQVDGIMKHIHALKYGDLSKRVDSLVALNEIIANIGSHEAGMSRCANDLCQAITHVLVDVFEVPIDQIPLRFAKYFVTIVHKVCGSKDIMRKVDEQTVFDLAEQLLTRLLIDNLDKIGEGQEGQQILKNLNASVLRLLENCVHTHIFCVLFNLLRKYKDYTVLPKLPGLIIKCLLKLSNILSKLVDQLDLDKILLVIHEYLTQIDHQNRTSNDDMGIRIVKTVINEIVKMKREGIWTAYRVVECHSNPDNHIKRWVEIILKSLQGSEPPPNQEENSSAQAQDLDKEIRGIIDELRSTDQFEGAIPKLHNFLLKHPQVQLQTYLSELSSHFGNFIKTHLEQYQRGLSDSGSTPDRPALKKETSQLPEQPQDSPSIQQEPQSSISPQVKTGLAQPSPYGGRQTEVPMPSSAKSSGLKFPAAASSGSRLSESSQPSGPGSGGGAGSGTFSSATDRITQYQSKLMSMRERKQQQENAPVEQLSQQQSQLATPKLSSGLQRPTTSNRISSGIGGAPRQSLIGSGQGQKQALSTSFSAMNTSLQARWSKMKGSEQKPSAVPDENQAQPSQPTESPAKETSPAQAQPSSGIGGGATNQDLNRRLAEMKAKLQALKKPTPK